MKGQNASAIAIATAMVALAVLATAAHLPRFEAHARLDHWRPTRSLSIVMHNLQRRRLARLPPAESYREMVDSFMHLNLALSPGAEPRGADHLKWLETRHKVLTRGFVDRHGIQAYLAVGTHLSVHFVRHLRALAGWAPGALVTGGDTGPHREALRAVRALSGAFLEKAANSGLLRVDGKTDQDRMVVARLLWLENWLLISGRDLRTRLLTAAERAVVVKWKVEAGDHLPLERRLALVPLALKLDRTYPADYVEGVLLALDGRPRASAEAFRRSISNGRMRRLAREWLVLLRPELDGYL